MLKNIIHVIIFNADLESLKLEKKRSESTNTVKFHFYNHNIDITKKFYL